MPRLLVALALAALAPAALAPAEAPGSVSGERKQWHKVTLTLDGPFARERDTRPDPFVDYRLTVRFTHESGSPAYDVPGYFAADGNAGEAHSFDLAFDLARATPIDRIVGATYPLSRWREAIDHALGAGRLGTLKVAFDPRAD